jgi:hypothetical protein
VARMFGAVQVRRLGNTEGMHRALHPLGVSKTSHLNFLTKTAPKILHVHGTCYVVQLFPKRALNVP